MWRESLHAGCSVRASGSTASPRPKRSSCSPCSTTSAKTGSRGVRNGTSRRTSGSLVSGSVRRSFGSWLAGCSSRTKRVDLGVRLGSGSATREWLNLSSQLTGWSRRTCQVSPASRMLLTCRPTWPEGKETHVRRSSELQSSRTSSSSIGQLAARCPSGEEAQGEVTLGARQHASSRVCRCSWSYALPRALADDGEWSGWIRDRAGRRYRDGSTGSRPKVTHECARDGLVTSSRGAA